MAGRQEEAIKGTGNSQREGGVRRECQLRLTRVPGEPDVWLKFLTKHNREAAVAERTLDSAPTIRVTGNTYGIAGNTATADTAREASSSHKSILPGGGLRATAEKDLAPSCPSYASGEVGGTLHGKERNKFKRVRVLGDFLEGSGFGAEASSLEVNRECLALHVSRFPVSDSSGDEVGDVSFGVAKSNSAGVGGAGPRSSPQSEEEREPSNAVGAKSKTTSGKLQLSKKALRLRQKEERLRRRKKQVEEQLPTSSDETEAESRPDRPLLKMRVSAGAVDSSPQPQLQPGRKRPLRLSHELTAGRVTPLSENPALQKDAACGDPITADAPAALSWGVTRKKLAMEVSVPSLNSKRMSLRSESRSAGTRVVNGFRRGGRKRPREVATSGVSGVPVERRPAKRPRRAVETSRKQAVELVRTSDAKMSPSDEGMSQGNVRMLQGSTTRILPGGAEMSQGDATQPALPRGAASDGQVPAKFPLPSVGTDYGKEGAVTLEGRCRDGEDSSGVDVVGSGDMQQEKGVERRFSGEDSGYTQSVSSSSDGVSRATDSTSPLLATPPTEEDSDQTCTPVFDDINGGHGLVFAVGEGPNLNPGLIEASILEPDGSGVVGVVNDAKLSAVGLGVESEACYPSVQSVSPGKEEMVYRDGIIFPDLEEILSTDLRAGSEFDPRDLMSGSIEGYDGLTVDTILESEGISGLLKTFEPRGSAMCDIDVNGLCQSMLSIDESPEGACQPAYVASVVTVESEVAGPVMVTDGYAPDSDKDTQLVSAGDGSQQQPTASDSVVKKKRGRPRKQPPAGDSAIKETVKRKCGRPRKHPPAGDSVVKEIGEKKRGRPRKQPQPPAGESVVKETCEKERCGRTKDQPATNSTESTRGDRDVDVCPPLDSTDGTVRRKKKSVAVGLGTGTRSKSGRVIKPSLKVVEELEQMAQREGKSNKTSQPHNGPAVEEEKEGENPLLAKIGSSLLKETQQLDRQLDAVWQSPMTDGDPLPTLNGAAVDLAVLDETTSDAEKLECVDEAGRGRKGQETAGVVVEVEHGPVEGIDCGEPVEDDLREQEKAEESQDPAEKCTVDEITEESKNTQPQSRQYEGGTPAGGVELEGRGVEICGGSGAVEVQQIQSTGDNILEHDLSRERVTGGESPANARQDQSASEGVAGSDASEGVAGSDAREGVAENMDGALLVEKPPADAQQGQSAGEVVLRGKGTLLPVNEGACEEAAVEPEEEGKGARIVVDLGEGETRERNSGGRSVRSVKKGFRGDEARDEEIVAKGGREEAEEGSDTLEESSTGSHSGGPVNLEAAIGGCQDQSDAAEHIPKETQKAEPPAGGVAWKGRRVIRLKKASGVPVPISPHKGSLRAAAGSEAHTYTPRSPDRLHKSVAIHLQRIPSLDTEPPQLADTRPPQCENDKPPQSEDVQPPEQMESSVVDIQPPELVNIQPPQPVESVHTHPQLMEFESLQLTFEPPTEISGPHLPTLEDTSVPMETTPSAVQATPTSPKVTPPALEATPLARLVTPPSPGVMPPALEATTSLAVQARETTPPTASQDIQTGLKAAVSGAKAPAASALEEGAKVEFKAPVGKGPRTKKTRKVKGSQKKIVRRIRKIKRLPSLSPSPVKSSPSPSRLSSPLSSSPIKSVLLSSPAKTQAHRSPVHSPFSPMNLVRDKGSPIQKKWNRASRSKSLSPPGTGEWAEDCIDIHAMDDDMYATDVGEEDPLARIFPAMKPAEKPQKTTPRVGSRWSREAPCDLDLGPQPVPKGFVFQNGELRRKSAMPAVVESDLPRQAPLAGVHARLGKTMATGLEASLEGRKNAAAQAASSGSGRSSPLTPSTPGGDSPLFFSRHLGASPSRAANLASPRLPSSPSLQPKLKSCHPFLLWGSCKFAQHCRYQHVTWDTAPLHTVEELMLSYPLNLIPPRVARHYAANHHSCMLLEGRLPDLVLMVKHLNDVNLDGVAAGYQLFSSFNIHLSASFLCRLLGVVCSHGANHRLLKVILNTMVGTERRFCPEDYLLVLRTLMEHKLYTEMRVVYAKMKLGQVALGLPILSALLRCAKDLGEWVFQLLEDIRVCESQDGKDTGLFNQFLRTVDYQLLIKPTNLERVVQYVDSSHVVASRLSQDAFAKLCRAFSACQQWVALLSLFHRCLRLIPSAGALVCSPLELTIRHLGVSEKLMSVFERLTEEQKGGLGNQAWNKVMLMCAQKGRSQRATKFYNMVGELGKQLSNEVMLSLIEMFKRQHSLSFATTIMRDGLRRSPPLVPPLPLLTSLASSLETVSTARDLHLVVTSLLEEKTKPPLSIMDGLLKLCSEEKCFSLLAEVVKLARDKAVVLDPGFYQQVLVSLQQWGQDQEALAEVSSRIQRGDQGGKQVEVTSPGGPRSQTPLALNRGKQRKLLLHTTRPAPPTPSVMTVAEATAPSPPTAVAPADLVCPPQSPQTPSAPGRGNFTLEDMIEQSSPQEDVLELLKLMEFNGKLGQFRAVASILVDMDPSATAQHTELLVLSIWEAVTNNSKLRKANAFSIFLSHLSQCRQSALRDGDSAYPTGNPPLGHSLLHSDRWLVAQLGIALLRLCERNKEWQSGYVILHHLHRFGIHYVRLSQPPSPLPPLLPTPPSPCSVALTAVNLCLHLERETHSALEVMRGCEWVEASNETERDYRTEVLATLTQHCLNSKMLEDAWQCLNAIERGELAAKFVHPITNLHNKLLQGVLDTQNHQYALFVFKAMCTACLQCLPSVFSGLLQLLCDGEQVSLARELCEDAIAGSRYAPLVKRDQFDVTLPLGLIRLEMQLLLEDRLRKVAAEVGSGCTKDLTIHLSAGCRDLLEQVLTKDLSPPLYLTKVESKLVTVSSLSLREWCRNALQKEAEENAVSVDMECVLSGGPQEESGESGGSEVTQESGGSEVPGRSEGPEVLQKSEKSERVDKSEAVEEYAAQGESGCRESSLKVECSRLETRCDVQGEGAGVSDDAASAQDATRDQRCGDTQDGCDDAILDVCGDSQDGCGDAILDVCGDTPDGCGDVPTGCDNSTLDVCGVTPRDSCTGGDVVDGDDTDSCQVETAESGGDGSRGSYAAPLSGKRLLKLQKAAVCRYFINNLKPHFNTKFESRDDYTHLLRSLSVHFLATSQTFNIACRESVGLDGTGNWEVPVAVQREVADTVSNVLSKFVTYSQDLDTELGLNETLGTSRE